MRYSDDGGRTWSTWRRGQIGPIGAYRFKVSWHSLGLMRQPGREFEFAISQGGGTTYSSGTIDSGLNVTIEGATINPARR